MSLDPHIPPQTPPSHLGTAEKPANNLVMAILATLCCCVPTGIAAIVYAAQVDSKWSAGDFAGAQHASEESKKWSYISIALGILFSIAYFGLGLAGGALEAA